MKYLFGIIVLLCFSACDSSPATVSEEIARQFQSSGRTFVNLVEVLPAPWEEVCIFGPYSDNTAAKNVLGFVWDAEAVSSIATNDTIALLIFVREKHVVEYVEHPRRDGDFTNLSRQCFFREQATFYHLTNPPKGWPGLFPKQ